LVRLNFQRGPVIKSSFGGIAKCILISLVLHRGAGKATLFRSDLRETRGMRRPPPLVKIARDFLGALPALDKRLRRSVPKTRAKREKTKAGGGCGGKTGPPKLAGCEDQRPASSKGHRAGDQGNREYTTHKARPAPPPISTTAKKTVTCRTMKRSTRPAATTFHPSIFQNSPRPFSPLPGKGKIPFFLAP